MGQQRGEGNKTRMLEVKGGMRRRRDTRKKDREAVVMKKGACCQWGEDLEGLFLLPQRMSQNSNICKNS